MLNIEHEETKTHNYYTFKSNGTNYNISITKKNSLLTYPISVYSNRFNNTMRNATLKCYSSLSELSKRSKALKNFVSLVSKCNEQNTH